MLICSVEKCNSKVLAKGYCMRHYAQLYRCGRILQRTIYIGCKVKGCENKHSAKGYCNKHHLQIHRCGKILQRTKTDQNEIVTEDLVCKIKLYNNKSEVIAETIIDKDDYSLVTNFKKWTLHTGYVLTKVLQSNLYLHNLIYPVPEGYEVDHINGNPLDNRKCNLRVCTRAQNCQNAAKPKHNTSGIKGVTWCKAANKWIARIGYNGIRHYLGVYSNKSDAKAAYEKASIELHGNYSTLACRYKEI